jgi:hypothetical protein
MREEDEIRALIANIASSFSRLDLDGWLELRRSNASFRRDCSVVVTFHKSMRPRCAVRLERVH